MTQVSVSTGLFFPNATTFPWSAAGATLDAATEKFAMIGRIYINGRPAGAKTLSTGNIQWRTGAVTFGNAGTTVDIGIQGVASGAGPIAQPDGSYSVKTTLTGGGGGITANAWQTTTMTSGTVDLTHGGLVAVVWDMTARVSDSVIVTAENNPHQNLASSYGLPVCNAFVSSAWQTTNAAAASRVPNCVIVFDDGTLGWIDGSVGVSVLALVETFADGTNPDERGLIFQVPWDCKVDALWANCSVTDANSDFTLKLYSAPTTAASNIASVAVAAENVGVAGTSAHLIMAPLAAEVSLSKNVDYCVSVLATGSSNVRLLGGTLGHADHRVQLPGGTTLAKGTRDGSSGNFTSASTVIMYSMGVRISSFDDGAGTGGGMIRHPGMMGGVNA